jgi:hypothetical protein
LSQNSQPMSEAMTNQRNSLINSQATSSSRSSSFYFKGTSKPPWSSSKPEKKKNVRRKPCPPKYSDVTDWSDAKSHLTSQETEESIHLQIEASENDENLFAHNARLLAQNDDESSRIPSRRKSSRTTSTADSCAKTWERLSEVIASSEECNTNAKPLHDLTNFNPILSSTQRDSVFKFPSYSDDGREALDTTLQGMSPKAETAASTQCVRRPVIEISSDEDSDSPPEQIPRAPSVQSNDSEEHQEGPEMAIHTRRNTRASYIEYVISDTEDEDDSQKRPTECQHISESEEEDDDEEEDVEKLQAKRCSILDVRGLPSSKLDTSNHLKEANIPVTLIRRYRLSPVCYF